MLKDIILIIWCSGLAIVLGYKASKDNTEFNDKDEGDNKNGRLS